MFTYKATSGCGSPATLTINRRYVSSNSSASFMDIRNSGLSVLALETASSVVTKIYYLKDNIWLYLQRVGNQYHASIQ